MAYDDLKLIDNLDLLLGPKTCLGILGHNGSGKTSLLKVIQGQASNYTGQVFLADDLRIVYFDQKRETIPQDKNLVEFLGNGSDYTMFKDQSIHVAAYASRFLFTSEKMHLKISQLSGGEQARLLIAKLLLQPADVLILDEPTNDLDIETIEILEETLIDFEGLVLLVSHDRFFMSQICNRFLALDGQGGWNEYPNLDQWLRHQSTDGSSSKKEKPVEEKRESKKARLSYNEKRRLENIEVEIEQAEQKLKNLQETMQDPQIMQDNIKLQEIASQFSQQQKAVEDLYSLWDELEAKR